MNRFQAIAYCVILLMLICGCAKRPAAGSRAEDERIVSGLEIEASKAIAAKDLDKLVDLYAEDAALYDERQPAIRGKDAIRVAWKSIFARPGLALTLVPRTVEVSDGGDMAWAHGICAIDINDSGGKTVPSVEYALIYTRQPDGNWKIMADSANSMLRYRLSPKPPESPPSNGVPAALVGLACFFSLLWFLFVMPILALVCGWKSFRSGKLSAGFLVSAVMLVVFFLAAAFLWWHFSAQYWNLSLASIFHAARDTARYGNPVEDTAEDLLVALLVLSTISAVAAGAVTGIARWAWRRRRPRVVRSEL